MKLSVNEVTKRFGSVTALANVSMGLEEGHIYGLLGSNGAGKTTLLNIISNRLYPDGGAVMIDGEATAENDRLLSMMFMAGDAELYPDDMRVRRAFKLAKEFYPGFDIEKAMALSARFGMDTGKKLSALSLGYSSIFRLVLALSLDVPFLLLDEPVLGLDAQHRDLFYRLLMEKFAEKPATILISTHLIEEAEPLIEHVFMIHKGEILRNAPVDELLSRAYSVSGPTAKLEAFLGGKTVLSKTVIGGLSTAIVEGARPEAVEGLEFGRIGLQDYFIALMNMEDAK